MNNDRYLPFSYSVKERKIDYLPGLYLDYPTSPVVIDRETWAFYVHMDAYSAASNIIRYKGPDFEHMVRQADGLLVTDGATSNHFGCGAWYDTSDSTLYVLSHSEYHHEISMSGGAWCKKKIRLYKSADLGLSWTFAGDVASSFLGGPGQWLESSGSNFEMGPADFSFFADERGGYFYIHTWNGFAAKHGALRKSETYTEVIRCAIADRMQPGRWFKFKDGGWTEPALGGRSTPLRFPTYGLYGNIIYNSYLEKYLYIGMNNGVGDPRFPSVCLGDGSIYISACTDLALQDWTDMAKLLDEPSNRLGGFTPTDAAAASFTECGDTMRLYNYWINERRVLDVTFGQNGSVSTERFPKYPAYSYESIPESGDALASRQTRIVGSGSPEMLYCGSGWTTEENADSFEGCFRKSNTPKDTVDFTFTGEAVYWRAAYSDDSGKADIYVDGSFCETVDCYFGDNPQVGHFAFIKKGLGHGAHTIKVVVGGDREGSSKASYVKHIGFEYSAESYKASAGYCSLQGKNNWYYQQRTASGDINLPVLKRVEGYPKEYWYRNYWHSINGNDRIGSDYMQGSAVRKWVAPHSGFICMEGEISQGKESKVMWDPCITFVDAPGLDTVAEAASQAATQADKGELYGIRITKGASALLALQLLPDGDPVSYRLFARVEEGEAISFETIR